LREIAPDITRVLYITSKTVGVGADELSAQAAKAAAAAGLTLVDGSIATSAEIAPLVERFAHEPKGGIVAAFNAFITVHLSEIVAVAARYRLPAIYPLPAFSNGGGLMYYGFDQEDAFRAAGDYVARILAGEKPGDLPVQEPTRYRLVINLRTAKTLGLTVPPTLLASADRVIE